MLMPELGLFCECGCGMLVRLGWGGLKLNRFVIGHNSRLRSSAIDRRLRRFCECGCGELVQKSKHRFLHNHHRRGIKRVFSDEHKRNIAKSRIGWVQSEEHVKNSKEAVRRFWDSPAGDQERLRRSVTFMGNKCALGTRRTEETKRNQSEKMMGRYLGWRHSEEQNRNHSENMIGKFAGDKHPNWQGGISSEPYSFEFNQQLKQIIRTRDNDKCQNPDCWGTGDRIAVHHIDYDKKNCNPNNLITVCSSCNSRANKGRKLWTVFYRELMKQQAEVA